MPFHELLIPITLHLLFKIQKLFKIGLLIFLSIINKYNKEFMRISSQRFKIEVIKKPNQKDKIQVDNFILSHHQTSSTPLMNKFKCTKQRTISTCGQNRKKFYRSALLKKKKMSEEHQENMQESSEFIFKDSSLRYHPSQAKRIQSAISNEMIKKSITHKMSKKLKIHSIDSKILKEEKETKDQFSSLRKIQQSFENKKSKPPSNDIYAITCLSINLSEAPILMKRKSAITPSKLLRSNPPPPPRRNVDIRNNQVKKYILFGTNWDIQNRNPKKFKNFISFLFKVNYSNRIYIPIQLKEKEKQQTQKRKVYVGNGNNHVMIKNILSQRFWIEIVNEISEETSFIWSPHECKEAHNRQRNSGIRRVEKQKGKIKKSLRVDEEIYEQNKKILCGIDSIKVQEFIQEQRIRIPWWNTYEATILTNHIPNHQCISSKKYLSKCLLDYYRHLGKDASKVLPKTYIVRSVQDPEFRRFQRDNEESLAIWIVKPGENTNQGKGIKLGKSHQVSSIVRQLKETHKHSCQSFIIQKYIQKPLLYNNRKFDFRHFVLLTSINGMIKAYWYREGYCRTSSQIYQINNLQETEVHLTNHGIQNKSANYNRYENGNKLSYAQMQRYIENGWEKVNFERDILGKMKEVIRQLVEANCSVLDPKRKQSNFELLGLDFMLDWELNPWLIQVNTNPSFETCCPLLSRIMSSLLENTFRLVFDPLFPPNKPPPKQSFSDHYLTHLKFEIIYDQNHSTSHYYSTCFDNCDQLQF